MQLSSYIFVVALMSGLFGCGRDPRAAYLESEKAHREAASHSAATRAAVRSVDERAYSSAQSQALGAAKAADTAHDLIYIASRSQGYVIDLVATEGANGAEKAVQAMTAIAANKEALETAKTLAKKASESASIAYRYERGDWTNRTESRGSVNKYAAESIAASLKCFKALEEAASAALKDAQTAENTAEIPVIRSAYSSYQRGYRALRDAAKITFEAFWTRKDAGRETQSKDETESIRNAIETAAKALQVAFSRIEFADSLTVGASLAAASAAAEAADAVGTDRFFTAVRKADGAAAESWERAQEVFGKPPADPNFVEPYAQALSHARAAWVLAEKAKLTHK